MKLAVRTEHLTRSFGDLVAVDDVSLEVPIGTVFGLLGPNGSGKTTTIRMLLGLLEPTAGSAEVLGQPVRTMGDEVRRSSGALLEEGGLYDRLTGLENLDLWGRIWRLDPSDRRSRAEELLDRFGLAERGDEPVGRWSTGMRKRLLIARALLPEPTILFLDEPTAGLDAAVATSLRQDLARLATSEGTTIFLTTHNLAEAEDLCQVVALIRAGSLMAVGPPAALEKKSQAHWIEVAGQRLSERVRSQVARLDRVLSVVSGSNGRLLVEIRERSDAPTIIRTIVAAGGEVQEVSHRRRSLEDIYLDIMKQGDDR